MKPLRLFALLALALGSLPARAANVGDRAPEIHFDKILPEQPASNASIQSLTGKVVVVEMWATWCGPCIEAIPHLNKLAEEFKDGSVVFISVSNEEPAVVEAFLKKRPISGLVGIAHTQDPAPLYGVEGIPSTILIDRSGKIAGITNPDLLTASMLEGLLRGQPLPTISLSIQPSQTWGGLSFTGTNNVDLKSESLRTIIWRLWGIQESRVLGDPLSDPTGYDVSLSIPGTTKATFSPWARDVISSAFHIKVTRETRDTEALVLSKTLEKPPALQPTGTCTDLNNQQILPAIPPATGGAFKLCYTEVSMVAKMLESYAKKTVVDETGITGKYDIQISYDKSGPDGLIEGLRKAGFKIEQAHRMIDFLIVTKAN